MKKIESMRRDMMALALAWELEGVDVAEIAEASFRHGVSLALAHTTSLDVLPSLAFDVGIEEDLTIYPAPERRRPGGGWVAASVAAN